MSTMPIGADSRRPQGAFFSMAITPPSAIIQSRLALPTANMSSINAQQQPTQYAPCSTPSLNECHHWRASRASGS